METIRNHRLFNLLVGAGLANGLVGAGTVAGIKAGERKAALHLEVPSAGEDPRTSWDENFGKDRSIAPAKFNRVGGVQTPKEPSPANRPVIAWVNPTMTKGARTNRAHLVIVA